MINKKILIALVLLVISLNFILASCSDGQVDINSASAVELDKIKWVGPATAANIISSRPFSSLDDLLKVSGIGEIKLQDIKDQGIACVTGSDSATESKENNTKNTDLNSGTNTSTAKETNNTEVIVSQQETPSPSKEEVLNPINLNPKSINTEENIQKITKRNYALLGLGVFLIFIILLLIIKKRKNKNEFR